MAPALENAKRADFAVPLPTPARALVAAHRRYLHQDELSVSSGLNGSDTGEVSLPERLKPELLTFCTQPLSPPTSTINLGSALCGTSAGFLVSNDPISPTKRLPMAVLNAVPSSFKPTYSTLNRPRRVGRRVTQDALERKLQVMEVKLL